MKYRKIKEMRLNPERVCQLVKGIDSQTKEAEKEYHELQMNHEVTNNE